MNGSAHYHPRPTTRNVRSDVIKDRNSLLLWGLLVCAVVMWNAREVIGFDFVAWDDELNITVNPHLGPPTAENVAWMFGDWSYMRRYVPFGWLGFSIAYAFSGLSPTAYHVGNLLLHVSNAVLLYVFIAWALRRWITDASENWIPPCAAAGALFWAVHPFRAETVGWASGMLYSLACFLGLLSVLAYCFAHYAGRSVNARAWRWSAAILYAISLLSYPITIGLIIVFLAIDAAEWRRDQATIGSGRNDTLKPLLLQKIPFVSAAIVVTAVTIFARVSAGPSWGRTPTLDEFGLGDRLVRAFQTIGYFLWKTCWPTNLTPLPNPVEDSPIFGLLAILTVSVIGWLTWRLMHRRKVEPGIAGILVCYIGLLFPMLGLTERMYYTSDRYSYLPAMALSVGLSAAFVGAPRQVRWVAGLAAVLVVSALAGLNSVQLRVWQDSPTLFARCIEKSTEPQNTADVYQRWANFHSFRGDVAVAEAVLARADRNGVPPAVLQEITVNLAEAKDAMVQRTAPLVARIHGALALDLARRHRAREADEHFNAALKLAPHFESLRYQQALHAAASDDPRRALRLLLAATAQTNGSISVMAQRQAWSVIAQSFARMNEPELARHAAKRADLLTDS